ncbi:DsbA family protein [Candidatus Parcubacteria bacterium]|nr:DsbA family protein [Candidatus Parcubacteria bacterium]
MNKTTVIAVVLIILAFGGLYFAARRDTGENGAATAVVATDWTRGAKNPKVTMIEYSDFQCPACGAYEPLLAQAQAEFKDTLQFAYRHFPLTQIHQNALLAAQASEAAGKQGKFWEMHDLLFQKQSEWSNSATAKALFEGYAATLKLNAARFAADIDSKEVEDAIKADFEEGLRLGVNATPTIYVNGKKIASPRDYAALKSTLEAAIATGTATSTPQ